MEDSRYTLASNNFIGASGIITRQVMLTTTTVTTSTISGKYAEKIRGLSPQDLAIRGIFTLTLSVDQPVAGFNALPSAGPAPLGVAFYDWSQGNPSSWNWDFGDGDTSSERHPSHMYAAAGLYTVTLTVTNAAGSDTLVDVDCVEVLPVTKLYSYLPVMVKP